MKSQVVNHHHAIKSSMLVGNLRPHTQKSKAIKMFLWKKLFCSLHFLMGEYRINNCKWNCHVADKRMRTENSEMSCCLFCKRVSLWIVLSFCFCSHLQSAVFAFTVLYVYIWHETEKNSCKNIFIFKHLYSEKHVMANPTYSPVHWEHCSLHFCGQ